MQRTFIALILCYASLTFATTIQPNENLIVDGLPELSTDLIEQTKPYTDFRPTLLLDIHPTQEQLLIKKRPKEGQTPQLHTLDAQKTETCHSSFPDEIISAVYEPNKGAYCVFSKDVNGAENRQNYRYDFDTGAITLLTNGCSRHTLGVWSHQGHLMAYTSNCRNGKDQDVYLINPLDPNSKHLVMEFSCGDGLAVLDWSPDDTHLLILEYPSANETYLWSIDLTQRTLSRLTPKVNGEKVIYMNARYHQKNSHLYLITNQDNEFNTLAQMDLKTGQFKYLTQHIPWDIERFSLSPQGDRLAFVSNEAGFNKLYLMTLHDHRIEALTLKNLPRGLIFSIDWDPQGKNLYFNFTSAKIPAEIFRLELKNQRLTRITETASEIDTNTFVEPELISWKSFDGKEISGFLYRPQKKGHEKLPVRVEIHGGPEAQFRPGFLYAMNYSINELGIAFLFPNIRGSTGYGKTFLQMADGMQRVDAYEDLSTLMDWIKLHPDLDGDRIMVSGGSYGGHAALAVATRYNDKIACSLSVVGMSNLVTFLENTAPYRQDQRRAVYGDERIPEVRHFLESIAPIHHAHQITKPIFIIQGLMDPRIPYSEAEQMVNTLKAMKTPVWFLTAKNEGHGFAKKDNSDFQCYATIEFMKRYLCDR